MNITAELSELSRNLWWTWRPEDIAVFRDLDSILWRQVNHNPVAFLDPIPADSPAQRPVELALEARISYAFNRLQDRLTMVATRLQPRGCGGSDAP